MEESVAEQPRRQGWQPAAGERGAQNTRAAALTAALALGLELAQQVQPLVALASVTHCESQSVLQQYGSWLQTLVTQAEQVLTNGPPVAQTPCAQPVPQALPQLAVSA